MKKNIVLISALIIALGLGVASCDTKPSSTNPTVPTQQEDPNSYTLPDLYNLDLMDAKLAVGANVRLQTVEVETAKLIDGRILGYKDAKVGDKVSKGSTVEVEVARKLSNAIEVGGNNIVDYVTQISKITGYDSLNAEMCKSAKAKGTDLGIPFTLPDGRVMLLYGDTNLDGKKTISNFMAITSDFDLSDGLTFDEILTDDEGYCLPFFDGRHQPGNETDRTSEVTKIPTGGISIGNDVYIFYMSIRFWGVASVWLVNNSGCVKATDNTYKHWEPVESLSWGEEEFYYGGQPYPFYDPKDPEHIYFTSIPGGRADGAVMFRVAKDKFENRDEYEYLVAADTWVKGDEGMKRLNDNVYYVLGPAVSEPCIMYNNYLGKYIYSTLKGTSICFCLADNVTGPYKEAYKVCSNTDFFQLYGGFLHEKFQDYDGKRMFMQMSLFDYYNVYVVEVVLK